MKSIFYRVLLCSACIQLCGSCLAKVPLFLGSGPNTTGIRRITNVGNVSIKSIEEIEFVEVAHDNREIKVLVRLPKRNGKTVQSVSAVVFIAPYPSDNFRSARSPLANALVARLGCAVVAIPMDSKREDLWRRGSFYLYPDSGYFQPVERAVRKVQLDFGSPDTPIFALGSSGGAVMSLYLAQSKSLRFDAVVAFELSQDQDFCPDLFAAQVPILALNPEDSPWNLRIARRLAEEAPAQARIEFCITRPKIEFDESAGYYRRAGGAYANELAYCFLRDAVELKKGGKWPGEWKKRPVDFETFDTKWTTQAHISSPDFEQLYRMASHSVCEASSDGRSVYVAKAPFYRKGTLLVLRERPWRYLDQVRISALLVQKGFDAVVCNAPIDTGLEANVKALVERFSIGSPRLAVITVAQPGDTNTDLASRVASAAPEVDCISVYQGADFSITWGSPRAGRATIRARSGEVTPEMAGSDLLYSPSWMLPKDLSSLIDSVLQRFWAP